MSVIELNQDELKVPEKFVQGEIPSFYYVGNIEIGQLEDKINLKMDALKLTNLNWEAEKYYRNLFEQKKKQGYENIRLMRFSNNGTTAIVVQNDNGSITLYLTPNEEIDFIEQEHLRDLSREGKIYNGNYYVPFSSTGSDSQGNVVAYKNALINFNKHSQRFTKSQGRRAA